MLGQRNSQPAARESVAPAATTARGRGALALAVGVLALGWLAVVAGFTLDRSTQQVQALADRYFAAVERKDVATALDTLAVEARPRWRRWVENQTGNHYAPEGVAARAPSLLDRLARPDQAGPTEATITARITLESGEPWPRPGVTVVGLVWEEGQLRFREPPFHPPEGPGD
jgi:hypothetical protein